MSLWRYENLASSKRNNSIFFILFNNIYITYLDSADDISLSKIFIYKFTKNFGTSYTLISIAYLMYLARWAILY